MNEMISNRVTIFAILCLSTSKANQLTDLDYYYLDSVGTQQPTQVIPQDEQDAQLIIDSKNDPDVAAGILMYRDKIRRININKEIARKNKKHPFMEETRLTMFTDNPTEDFFFSLVFSETMVMCTYMYSLMSNSEAPLINIGLTLTKDMMAMIKAYDDKFNYTESFKDARKRQSSPFENMLRVWCARNREPNEKEPINQASVDQHVEALLAEYNDGGWHENRDKIEEILMKKSVKYAREVIKKFEIANKNQPMEVTITESIDKHHLESRIADTYATLTRYLKNRNKYIADILRQYSDGKEHWAVWIMCLAVTASDEWVQIDKEFRKADTKQDISLSDFIEQKTTDKNYETFGYMVSPMVDV